MLDRSGGNNWFQCWCHCKLKIKSVTVTVGQYKSSCIFWRKTFRAVGTIMKEMQIFFSFLKDKMDIKINPSKILDIQSLELWTVLFLALTVTGVFRKLWLQFEVWHLPKRNQINQAKQFLQQNVLTKVKRVQLAPLIRCLTS